MKSRKVRGYIWLAVSIIAGLMLLGNLPQLIKNLIGLLFVITGGTDAYTGGYIFGSLGVQVFIIVFFVTSIKNARRNLKAKDAVPE